MKQLLARGFTIVEILIVIFVMAILALLVVNNIQGSTERAYLSRTVSEFTTFANALNLYAAKYNDYPADVSRSLPASLNEFIAKNEQGEDWPDAPWPGSVYDYENWPDLDGVDTYQISVRFCPVGGPLSACKFPKEPWVTASWGVNSAVYYCLKGNCRSHQSEPKTYPGYCINCPNHTAI
jgi:prepilin-type N-terminal cleavage/methylation domain-containing protein